MTCVGSGLIRFAGWSLSLGAAAYVAAVAIFLAIVATPFAIILTPLFVIHGARYLPVCMVLAGATMAVAPVAARSPWGRVSFVLASIVLWSLGATVLGVVEEAGLYYVAQHSSGAAAGGMVAVAALAVVAAGGRTPGRVVGKPVARS